MDNTPIKKEDGEKSDEDFFSFSSSPPKKEIKTPQTPTRKLEPEEITPKAPSKILKEPPKSDSLKASPGNVKSPVVDLSSSKFTKPNPIFIKKKDFSQKPKRESDTIGNIASKRVQSSQIKTSPERRDKYHEPIEDLDTPKPTVPIEKPKLDEQTFQKEPRSLLKEKKIRPERPDKYHEPIEELIPPKVKESGEAVESARRLSEVEKRIQQIESVMPTDVIPEKQDVRTRAPERKEDSDEIDSVKVVNKEDIDEAVEEILGYVEMLGGATSNGESISPEEIAAMATDLFLGKDKVTISQIPTESGVQALVRKFADELGVVLK